MYIIKKVKMVYPTRRPVRPPVYPVQRFPVRQYPAMPQQNKPSSQKHIFGYVIVGSVILILVLLVALQFASKGKSDVVDFREELESDFSSKSLTGAVVKDYELPQGYNEICFTDMEDVEAVNVLDNSIIQGNVIHGVFRNVYLFGEDKKTSFYVDGLNLGHFPYYACAKTENGKVSVELNSDGREVDVKLPVNEKYCKNSQETRFDDGSNLCSYLNKIYYEGYKEECCSDHGYCC